MDGPDLDDLDGCDAPIDPLPAEEEDLFVLFAEALDPSCDVTVDEVAAAWGGK